MKFLSEKYCVLKNFCNFVADLVKTISRHIRNDKKRYAYLIVGNVGNSRLIREIA